MPEDFGQVFNKLHSMIMGETEEVYSDKAITLAYEPLNVGEIENPDGASKIKGDCGDTLQIHLRLTDGVITETRFLTDGCAATLACGSAVTELVKNKTPFQATKIYPQTIVKYLDGLPPSHMHCAVLAVQALKVALKSMKTRQKSTE